jgi:acetate kinase
MPQSIFVLNTGSSSIKFQLFAIGPDDRLERQIKGQVGGIGVSPQLVARNKDNASLVERSWPASEVGDVPTALDAIVQWLRQQLSDQLPIAVGHRVVHGGPFFKRPVLIDDPTIERLETLNRLAPLHQPVNLAAIKAIRARHPDLPQVACFDTAFHSGHPDVADRYAIPDPLYQEGVRRYGFHGLSYEFVARSLPHIAPGLSTGRVVVAHLGSGASMCAIKAGRSVESTMGFTAMDGLPMGTRTGQIDPGVLLYLLTEKKWDAERLTRFLYHDCGLKGLSGVSNDMRELLASKAPLARLAVGYFTYRIVRETGALAAAMGGIDGLVFTGGIGENAPPVRSGVCDGLAWLGLELDEAANGRHGPRISTAGSRVSAWVIPTDEERMIAEHTLAALHAPVPARAAEKEHASA